MIMYVDSLKVSKWTKHIWYEYWKTPQVTEIHSPRYVKTNSIVEFGGKFYTDAFGNAGADEDSLDNDNESVEIVSVFVGKIQSRKGIFATLCL